MTTEKATYRMVAPEGDYTGGTIRETGLPYEYDLLRTLRRVARRGSLVIDVGANIGNHALYFAVVCGCQVHAFEPNPAAFRWLEENVALNGLHGQVITYLEALSDRPGRASLRQLQPEHPGLGTIAAVRDANGSTTMVRLDDVNLSGRVSVLKVDVEGGESEVLEGARGMLRSHEPVIAVEAQSSRDRERLDTQLADCGYSRLRIEFARTPTFIYIPRFRAALPLLAEPVVRRRVLTTVKARLTAPNRRRRVGHKER